MILLKDDERAIVDEVFAKIDSWLIGKYKELDEEENIKEGKGKGKVSTKNNTTAVTTPTNSSNLELPSMNSFQRLIFYQQIPLKYGDTLSITKRPSGNLSVKRASLDPDSRVAAFNEEKVQFDKALDEQIGFRRVMDCIIEAKVPVIGHNCWVDFLHFYQKFIDNNLPNTIQGFKEEILKCFPVIIDTKYLARLVNIKDTSLGDLTELASKYPERSFFAVKETANGGESSTNLFHDAGFDAICTGRVFLSLLSNFLRPKDLSESPLHESLSILLGNDTLYNRLNILQSDYAHLDLTGKELEPDRSGVLYVYGIGGNTSISDLQAALQLLLKINEKISCQIYFLNEGTAAFIQFEQSERALDILKAMEEKEEKEEKEMEKDQSSPSKASNLLNRIKIVTYLQYQEKRDQLIIQENNNESIDSNSRKRSKRE